MSIAIKQFDWTCDKVLMGIFMSRENGLAIHAFEINIKMVIKVDKYYLI